MPKEPRISLRELRRLGATVKPCGDGKLDVCLYGVREAGELPRRIRGRRVRSLNLNGARVRDEDVACLAHWKTLRALELSGTEVTDALVPLLSGKRLRSLRIDGSALTDRGLIQLFGEHPLEVVWMDGLQAGVEVARACADSPSLRSINLFGPHVTDATLAVFRDVATEQFGLAHSAATGAGTRHIRTERLIQLGLCHSPGLTDEAAEHLLPSESVKHVWVVGSGITSDGKHRLRRKFPNALVGP